MARRYKVGLHPSYDTEFDRQKVHSAILNKNVRNDLTLKLWSRNGVAELLKEWAGNGSGAEAEQFIGLDGYWQDSILKGAKARIAEVDQRFENMKTIAIRSGKYPPEELPNEMVEQKLVREARLDIILEEIEALKKKLSVWDFQAKQLEEDVVLKYGPAGSTKGADPPREADGQPIRWDEKDGNFLIDCPKSPYHGMRLPDYYATIVKPWLAAKQALYQEAYKKGHDLELNDGERINWARKADFILKSATEPPWPERPKEA